MRTKRTKLMVAAAVGAIALSLTACDDTTSGTPEPSTSTTTQSAPTTTPRVAHPNKPTGAVDDIYVDFLHDNGIYSSRGTLIELGHTICEAFDQGMSFEDVGLTALTSGTSWDADQIGTVIGASVAAYCPWNEHVIPGGQPA